MLYGFPATVRPFRAKLFLEFSWTLTSYRSSYTETAWVLVDKDLSNEQI